MIPDALIVALSGSVSNHWSRKSAARHRHQLDEDRLLALRQLLEAAERGRRAAAAGAGRARSGPAA